MGIFTEINLYKPENGAYYPGDTVTGVIKWAVDEESVFNNITVSLKGLGRLVVIDHKRRRDDKPHTFTNSEEYVDIDYVFYSDEKGGTYAVNLYETYFTFKLPENIPPSFNYSKHILSDEVRCKIFYYIRIKFSRPGFLAFAKRFKKEIIVLPGVTLTLPTEPTVYGEQKTLFHITKLFSSNKSVVNMKASIENSVIPTGGNIEINYEVKNASHVDIKGVEAKIVEVYSFKPIGHTNVITEKYVPGTDSKTGAIKTDDTQSMLVEISVPSKYGSLENSKIVSREYFVTLTAELPMPHTNAVLRIPLQIGNVVQERENVFEEPPPSYWEVMGDEGDEKE